MSTNFDDYQETYSDEVARSIAFLGTPGDWFTVAKTRHLLALARRYWGDLASLRVLDFGCGTGTSDRFVVSQVRALHGIDTAAGLLAVARRMVPEAQYHHYDGTALPFPDATFDLVFAICVMHHITPASWLATLREMSRVTRAAGLVVLFEHNPLNPLTRLAVCRCPFDRDATLLRVPRAARLLTASGLQLLAQRYVLFFPWQGRFWHGLEQRLSWLPLGAQYYVAGRKEGL